MSNLGRRSGVPVSFLLWSLLGAWTVVGCGNAVVALRQPEAGADSAADQGVPPDTQRPDGVPGRDAEAGADVLDADAPITGPDGEDVIAERSDVVTVPDADGAVTVPDAEAATPDAAFDAADAEGGAGDGSAGMDALDGAGPDTGSNPDSGDARADAEADVLPRIDCTSSMQCAASPRTPVCESSTGLCAPCTDAEDVCPVGNYCRNNACVPGCRSNADCTGTARACNVTTHTCQACYLDDDCPLGSVCRSGTCTAGCTTAHGCGIGASCCGGRCVDLASDPNNCAACGTRCNADQTCCNRACINTNYDDANCGGCGVTCRLPSATAICVSGQCAVGTCVPGRQDCDGQGANGCEVVVATDPMNCGLCRSICPSAPNSRATCANGRCGIECMAGFTDCNGNAFDGCEADLARDVMHCGGCATVCASRPNAFRSCEGGSCAYRCAGTFADCDGDGNNGCETDLQSSTSNCGACGTSCTSPHGIGACSARTCLLAACESGWADCDTDSANGCETSVVNNALHCGTCGTRCGSGESCVNGMCMVLSACPPGTTRCGTLCVDLTSDLANCGSCARACQIPAHGTAACVAGACGAQCAAGYADCNMAVADGCEVDTTSSLSNCGACGRVCNAANAVNRCTSGTCQFACTTGFADCDLDPANGCEVDTGRTVTHCGACNRVCSFPHAAAACAMGACSPGACDAGFGNCNGNASDGCETDLSSSSGNCGACGTVCPAGTACAAGVCASTCPSGKTYCDASRSCVDLTNDNANCGACARACPTGQRCVDRACVTPPPANDLCAAATPIDTSTSVATVTATLAGATAQMAAPAACAPAGTADVFYSFTLSRREMVYADTFGSTGDTVLYFARSCATGPVTTATTARDVLCNDDASAAPIGCAAGTVQSQVVGLFDAGTYLLVLSNARSTLTTVTVRFAHLPVGTRVGGFVQAGSSRLEGTTNGIGASMMGAGLGCGGSGPEVTYWWTTCPTFPGGTLNADTCSNTQAFYDTGLYYWRAGAAPLCDDNGCGGLAVTSKLSTNVPAGAGLQLLWIDGDSSWITRDNGSYRITVSRP